MVSARRKAFERGELDLNAASEFATSIMQRFFDERTVEIPIETPQPPVSLTAAVFEAFGPRRGDADGRGSDC